MLDCVNSASAAEMPHPIPVSSVSGYAMLLSAFEFDSGMANVAWALLSDSADAIWSCTSSRRISALTGLADRTVSRYLARLNAMELLQASGSSLTKIRYSLNRDAFVDFCISGSKPLPVCLVGNAVLNDLGNSSMSEHPAWLVLMCQLRYDYVRSATLASLIAGSDQDGFVTASGVQLGEALAVPTRTIYRAIEWLESFGLISRAGNGALIVQLDVVRALLNAPLPQFDVLPGLTPLDALQRLFPVVPVVHFHDGGLQ